MIRTRLQLGVALAAARHHAGLTQRALAALAGTRQARISMWETAASDMTVSSLLNIVNQLDHRMVITSEAEPTVGGIRIHSARQAGLALHDICRMQGMTQRELAAAIGSTESVVSKWKNHDLPSLVKVIQAAGALGWQLAFVPGPEEDA